MMKGIARFMDELKPRALSATEWAVMRVLFAVLLAWHFADRQPFSFKTNPHPVGITTLFSLGFLGRPGMYEAQWCIVAPALLLYVSGWWQAVSTTVLAWASLLVRSHVNAQGFNQHSTQVMTLVLICQCAVAWVAASRKRKDLAPSGIWEAGVPGVMLYYSQGILAASYVLAGLAKVLNSKGLWAWNAPYISTDIVKSTRQAYYSTLDEAFAGTVHAAQWLVDHPWLTRAGFAAVLLLELGAFVGMRSRLWALVIGVGLIAMHMGIQWMMHLSFFYNEAVLFIFFVNPAGWMILWWGSKLRPALR
jgi:hypothetical protein